MNRYKEGGYVLEIDKGIVDLYVGGVCVKTKKTTQKENELDTAKRVVNNYIKGEGFKDYQRICRIIDRMTKSAPLEEEELYLEWVKSIEVKHLRRLLERAEAVWS